VLKYIIYISLLISSFSINAQRIRPFVGGAAYLHTDFEKSSFGNLCLGSEYRITNFLRPEIEISYMYGTLETKSDLDEQGLTQSILDRSATALNYSFCPKIVLGDHEDDTSGHLQILPKYTISKIEAKRTLSSRNPNNLSNPIVEKERVTDLQHSLGIGIGLTIGFSEEYSNTLAINLYYNGINLGTALNKLKHNGSYEFNTQDVLGLGVNFYLGFKKKKQSD
jgi:hypothetical protein